MTRGCVALDAHPRRCFLCGVKIFECMGAVLARDILPILQAITDKKPIPAIKVRELCGRCVAVWGRIWEDKEDVGARTK